MPLGGQSHGLPIQGKGAIGRTVSGHCHQIAPAARGGAGEQQRGKPIPLEGSHFKVLSLIVIAGGNHPTGIQDEQALISKDPAPAGTVGGEHHIGTQGKGAGRCLVGREGVVE